MKPHDDIGDRYAPSPAVMREGEDPVLAVTGDIDTALLGRWGVGRLSKAVDLTLSVWWRTLPRMLLLGVLGRAGRLGVLALEALGGSSSAVQGSAERSVPWIAANGALFLVSSTLFCFAWIGAIRVAADQVLFKKQSRPLFAMIWEGRRWFWRFLGGTVLFCLGVGACLTPGIIAEYGNFGVAEGFLYIVGGAAAVGLGVRWLLYDKAIVFEGATVLRAFSRSWELVRGCWWSVFGWCLFVVFVVFVAAVPIVYVARHIGPRVGEIVVEIMGMLVLGFLASWTTALYASLHDAELAVRSGAERGDAPKVGA
jgi:hypothetical protein